jgi:hypothetical protein
MKNMELADVVRLAKKKFPIKILPGSDLRVYQGRQYRERDSSEESAFFIHVSRKSPGAVLWMAVAEHNTR